MLSGRAKNARIAEIREDFRAFHRAAVENGWLLHNDDLYLSDHLAQRIYERDLESEIALICRIAKHFMIHNFYGKDVGIVDREYIVKYKAIAVGILIRTGLVTRRRFVSVASAFKNEKGYVTEGAQVIKLRDST